MTVYEDFIALLSEKDKNLKLNKVRREIDAIIDTWIENGLIVSKEMSDADQNTATGLAEISPQFAKPVCPGPHPSCKPDGDDPQAPWRLDLDGFVRSLTDGVPNDAEVTTDNKWKFTAEAGRDGRTHQVEMDARVLAGLAERRWFDRSWFRTDGSGLTTIDVDSQ